MTSIEDVYKAIKTPVVTLTPKHSTIEDVHDAINSNAESNYASSSPGVISKDIIDTEGFNFQPSYYSDSYLRRAQNQSGWAQVGLGLANIIPNIGSGFIRDIGYLSSLFAPGDNTYDNAAIRFGEDGGAGKDIFGEVYREHPEKVFDFTDPAFYVQGIEQTVESVGTFALEGIGLGKVFSLAGTSLAKGLSMSAKLTETVGKLGLDDAMLAKITESEINGALAARGSSLLHAGAERIALGLNSYSLGFVEGAQIANGVYKEVYNKNIADGRSDEYSKAIASKAATTAAAINTALVGSADLMILEPLMQLSGKTEFFKGAFKPLEGELETGGVKAYADRLNGILADSKASAHIFKHENLGKLMMQDAAQEFYEEAVVNNFAEWAGKWQGGVRKQYYDDPRKTTPTEDFFREFSNRVFSQQGLLEGLLGALGGLGQSGIIGSYKNQKVFEEVTDEDGTSRLIDTGKKETAIDATVRRKREYVASIINNLQDDTEKLDSIQTELKALAGDNSPMATMKRNAILNTMFHPAILKSVMSGTGDLLINSYKNFANVDNTTLLDEKINKEVIDAEAALQTAINNKDTENIDALTKQVNDLKNTQKQVAGKTEAMALGLAKNQEDNAYVSKANNAIKLIEKLSDLSDFIESNYQFDYDTQLSGYAKEMYRLHLVAETADLNTKNIKDEFEVVKNLMETELKNKKFSPKDIANYYDEMYDRLYKEILTNKITDNTKLPFEHQFDKTKLEELQDRFTELATMIIEANAKAREKGSTKKTQLIDVTNPLVIADLQLQQKDTAEAYHTVIIEAEHEHDQAIDKLSQLTKPNNRQAWVNTWKNRVSDMQVEAKAYKQNQDKNKIEEAKTKDELDKIVIDKKDKKLVVTKAKKGQELQNKQEVEVQAKLVKEKVKKDIIDPIDNTVLNTQPEIIPEAIDQTVDVIPPTAINTVIVPTVENGTIQTIIDLNLPPQVNDALDAFNALVLPNSVNESDKSKDTTYQSVDLTQDLPQSNDVVEGQLINAAIGFAHLINLMSVKFGEQSKFTVQDVIDYINTVDITGTTTSVLKLKLQYGAQLLANNTERASQHGLYYEVFRRIDFTNHSKLEFNHLPSWFNINDLIKGEFYRENVSVFPSIINSWDGKTYIPMHGFTDGKLVLDKPQADILSNMLHNPEFGKAEGGVTIEIDVNYMNENPVYGYKSTVHNSNMIPIIIKDNKTGLRIGQLITLPYIMKGIVYMGAFKDQKNFWFDHPGIDEALKATHNILFELYNFGKLSDEENTSAATKWKALMDAWYDIYNVNRGTLTTETENGKKGTYTQPLLDYSNSLDDYNKVQDALTHIAKVLFYNSRHTSVDLSSYDIAKATIDGNIDVWRDITNSTIAHVSYIRDRIMQQSFNTNISKIHGGTVMYSRMVNKDGSSTYSKLQDVIALSKDGQLLTKVKDRINNMPLWFRSKGADLLFNADDVTQEPHKPSDSSKLYNTVFYVMIDGNPYPVFNARISELSDSERYNNFIREHIVKGLTSIYDNNNDSLQESIKLLKGIILDHGNMSYHFNTNEYDMRFLDDKGQPYIRIPSFDMEYDENGETKYLKIQQITIQHQGSSSETRLRLVEGSVGIDKNGKSTVIYDFTSKIFNDTTKDRFDAILDYAIGRQKRTVANSDKGLPKIPYDDPIANEDGTNTHYKSYKEYVLTTGALHTDIAAYTNKKGVPISNVNAKGFSNLQVSIDMTSVHPVGTKVETTNETKVIKPVSIETKPTSTSKATTSLESLIASKEDIDKLFDAKELELISQLVGNLNVIIINDANSNSVNNYAKLYMNKTNYAKFVSRLDKAWMINDNVIIVDSNKFKESKPINGLLLHEALHVNFNSLSKVQAAEFYAKTAPIIKEVTERIAEQQLKEGDTNEVLLILNWLKEIDKQKQEAYTYIFETFDAENIKGKAIANWLARQTIETEGKEESLLRRLFKEFLNLFNLDNTLLGQMLDVMDEYIKTVPKSDIINESQTPIVESNKTKTQNLLDDLDSTEDFDLYSSSDITLTINDLVKQARLNGELQIKCSK
jgi:hypothetical protein